jgi:chemotaxis protein CheY-P-specific phosphatase CheC
MATSQPQPIPALSELVAQAANRAASALAEMVNLPVSVQLSRAELVEKRQAGAYILDEKTEWGKAVHIHFDDEATGEALFLLPAGHDTSLAAALFEQIPSLQDAENPVDAILVEIGNVLLNTCVGTIANHMGKHIHYQLPETIEAPVIARFLDPAVNKAAQFLRMLSTLGVGNIKVTAYIVLIFYDGNLGLGEF